VGSPGCDLLDLELVFDLGDLRERGAPRVSKASEEQEVVVSRQPEVERPLLREGHAEEAAGFDAPGWMPRDPYRPARRLDRARSATENGALSRPVGSPQRNTLAG